MTEKKKVYRYSLFLNGLFGRNRKSKFESRTLITLEEKISDEEAKNLFDYEVSQAKIKHARAQLSEQECEDDGHFTSFMLFTNVIRCEEMISLKEKSA